MVCKEFALLRSVLVFIFNRLWPWISSILARESLDEETKTYIKIGKNIVQAKSTLLVTSPVNTTILNVTTQGMWILVNQFGWTFIYKIFIFICLGLPGTKCAAVFGLDRKSIYNAKKINARRL